MLDRLLNALLKLSVITVCCIATYIFFKIGIK